jgi:outer membrane cobalamin receptor
MHFLLLFILAVTPTSTTQPSIQQEIVVTASALPEEIDQTPVAATIITRDDMERREVRDVADILREVPGITVSRTGSPGKNTTLFIRGGSSKQALVLWNGVEMNNAYFSGYDFGQLSSAGVERVEVVRGPFSALYGSEAVSGVINVLTKASTSGASVDLAGTRMARLNVVRTMASSTTTISRRRRSSEERRSRRMSTSPRAFSRATALTIWECRSRRIHSPVRSSLR